MKPREFFLRALRRQTIPRPAAGSATSIVTLDLMNKLKVCFPEAHLDAPYRNLKLLAEEVKKIRR